MPPIGDDMARKHVSCLAAVGLLVTMAAPALAHHSFAAEFDAKRPVKLRGTVVKMEWINPHSWIHMDVKDPVTGKVERWMVEGGAPNALLRRGWTKKLAARGHRDSCRGLSGQGRRQSRERT
jgi:hypothetical protein